MNDLKKLTKQAVIYIGFVIVLFLKGCSNAPEPFLIKVSPRADVDAVVLNDDPVSLKAAKKYIAELNKNGEFPVGGVIVELEGGEYILSETLVFSAKDGGTLEAPVIYKAKEGERPVISGGQKISEWQDQGNNIWKVIIPDVANGSFYFRQLFANDKRMIRARTPNEGWYRIEGQITEYDTLSKWKLGQKQELKSKDPRIMCGARFDLEKLPFGEDDLNQGEIQMLSSWSQAWTTIQKIDEKTGDVLFNTPLDWPAFVFTDPNPYRIENVRSALDRPGEWYLNAKKGELFLQVNDGEDPNDWEVVVPRLEMLIKIAGTRENPVTNLTFDGIHFKHARVKMGVYEYTVHQSNLTEKMDDLLWDWPSDIQQFYPEWPDTEDFMPGYVDLQGAVYAGGALEAVESQNLNIKSCKFSHLGAHGIHIKLGSYDTEISNSEFSDLGGGGIYIGPITDEPLRAGLKASDVPHGTLVKNNLIQQGTKFHIGAVGIYLGQANNCKVINNEVRDMGYSGISMGWTWGHEPNFVFNNLIARNHVHRVVRNMADGGAIYTLGTQTACVIEENYLHHIIRNEMATGAHVKGLYFDEGSQGSIIRRNIIHDISDNYISYNKKSAITSFKFEENYLADSVLTHNGDYEHFKTHVPEFDIIYAGPNDEKFPRGLVDKIVAEAGIQ